MAAAGDDTELALRSPSLNEGPGPDIGMSQSMSHSTTWDSADSVQVVSPLTPVYMGTMSGSADTGNVADEMRLYQLYLKEGQGQDRDGKK